MVNYGRLAANTFPAKSTALLHKAINILTRPPDLLPPYFPSPRLQIPDPVSMLIRPLTRIHHTSEALRALLDLY